MNLSSELPPLGGRRNRIQPPIAMVGGFESTYLPAHDVDVVEITGHAVRWREDLNLLRRAGVTELRYPVRWHRVEADPGRYDWRATDDVLGHMIGNGMRPIVDLVHHTSYPRWLHGGFGDRRFPSAYLRYVERFARRYPETLRYTLFNEPFATLFLCGSESVWPPHGRGVEGFVRLLANVLPALGEASRMAADLLPGAEHVWVDTCEWHAADAAHQPSVNHAALCNDRRFAVLDLMLGVDVTDRRPFLGELCRFGGEALMDLPRGVVDVVGADYYAHSEWYYTAEGGSAPSPAPKGLGSLLTEYWQRYDRPLMVTETNIRGYASDRATWLRYALAECEAARAAGVPVQGLCWFPFIDSCDWDSLLRRSDGNIDPVGVYWLDEDLNRRDSCMARSFRMAASGVPARELPAYRLRPPARAWLEGYGEAVQPADWLDWPAGEEGSQGTPHLVTSPLSFGVTPRRIRRQRTAHG